METKKYGVESNSSKRVQTKQGKMEKSFLNFKANYPDWVPSKQGERYLELISSSQIPEQKTEVNVMESHSDNLYMSSFSKERQELENSIASLNKIHRQFFRTSHL